MNKSIILISTSSFGKNDITPKKMLLDKGFEVILNPFGRKLTEEEIINLIDKYKPIGLIAGLEPINDRVLKKAVGLRVISRCGTGVDNVDLKAAHDLGIEISNTPDAPALAVAELCIGLILAFFRNIPFMDSSMRKGKWERPMGTLLSEKTIGIIGCGRIGSTVGRLVRGFNNRVIGFDPNISLHDQIEMTSIEKVLSLSDIITIHIPYNKNSRFFIDEKKLSSMKDTALLVNTSRGGIIDENALAKALKNGVIAGACLDCYEEEPYSGILINLPNVVFSAHVGSYAKESRINMEKEAVNNLLDVLMEG